jgi:hypothetical protein
VIEQKKSSKLAQHMWKKHANTVITTNIVTGAVTEMQSQAEWSRNARLSVARAAGEASPKGFAMAGKGADGAPP